MRGKSDFTTTEWLKFLNGEHYMNDIAFHTGLSVNAVHCQYRRLKARGYDVAFKKKYDVFTKEDKEFINDNVGVISNEGVAEKLGYPLAKIERYISLNFPIIKKRKWTSKEDDFLLRNYKVYAFPEILKCLARTPRAIVQRVYKLNKRGRKFRTKEEGK